MGQGPRETSTFQDVAAAKRWRLLAAAKGERSGPTTEFDIALRLALELAGLAGKGTATAWHEPLFTEVRRGLYPHTFPAPAPEVARVAGFFFPLAQAVLLGTAFH